MASQFPVYDSLKPQHQRFVDFFVESDNACDAYIKAGYKAGKTERSNYLTTASSRLVTNVDIKNAVAERRRYMADHRLLSLREKQGMLAVMARENYRRGPDGEGDPKIAVMAIRELNKMEGDYAPTKHQTITGVVNFIQQIEEKPIEGEIVPDREEKED